MKKLAILLALFSMAAFAQQGTFTDTRDKNKYKTVKIGKQTWMAENLNFNAKGSVCNENKPENCKKYGRLYDEKAAKTACPKGWHLPTDEEWQELVDLAGGNETAGKHLKATSGWDNNEGKSGNGSDTHGFAALPGGSHDYEGSFASPGRSGSWQTASCEEGCSVRFMSYSSDDASVGGSPTEADKYSVRCIKD